jgi:ribokinase
LLPAIGCAQRAAALAVERHGTFASILAAIEMRQIMQAVSSEPSVIFC